MKKLLFVYLVSLFTLQLSAQAPLSFKYQAVARDLSGTVLAGKNVSFRISILKGGSTGLIAYSEVHSPVTDAFGLVNLEIGNGNPVSGAFKDIDWGNDKHYIRIEMDPEGKAAFQVMGVSQLLSVPYALYAGNAGGIKDADADSTNEIQVLSLSNKVISLSKNGGAFTLPPDYPEGPAGGDLAGSYPGPTIGSGKITTAKIAGKAVTREKIDSAAVTSEKIDTAAVTAEKIARGAITGDKIGQAGALPGQALKWNGSVWAPADDDAGITTLPLPFSGSAETDGPVLKIVNSRTANQATALWGHTDSPGFLTYGVRGSSLSKSGTGVVGEAGAAEGLNTGVYGYTASTDGRGIFGFAGATSGSTVGVSGQVNSREGQAVRGVAADSAGTNYGVVGITRSENGYGMYGNAVSRTGANFGVFGTTSSDAGTAVYGLADNGTGKGIGVRGQVISGNGYSGYFTGGRFYVGGNAGIGTENPKARLEVAGQIRITGGNPGYGKILASDSTGTASWVAPFSKMNLPFYDQAVSDTAVFKVVNNSAGTNEKITGLWGHATGSAGTGVRGTNLLPEGTGKGVWGEVVSPDAWSGYFRGGRFYVGGKVGIGTPSPTHKLDVVGDRIRLSSVAGADVSLRTDDNVGYVNLHYSCANLVIQGSKPGENILILPASDSRVGIRTWSPVYDLDVSGSIRATQGVFYGGTPGSGNATQLTKPDYVFGKDYKIMATSEVDEFIQTKKHLPWLTSAEQEKAENGETINMTRMTFETLESVENLQLQIIEQHKLLRKLTEQNERLQQENEEIHKRLVNLEKMVIRQ